MTQPAITADLLGKQYRLGGKPAAYGNLRESLLRQLSTRLTRSPRQPTSSTAFWALQEVSFEVPQGQVLGVIGRNGAGKSTLLKILARITAPTTGTARLRGRVGSLLEVGTGFHAELSGRENILLNGAILGMSRRDIADRFDQIVAFAEVERFLDTPVKRYSSGMYVRLAFAVAAHLNPEILLVDEVLAVGDADFQRKCIGKIESDASEGRTVLLVSHNMATVRRLAQRCLWLHNGRLRDDGTPSEVIDAYLLTSMAGSSGGEFASERISDGRVRQAKYANQMLLRVVRLRDRSGTTQRFFEGSDITIELEIESLVRVDTWEVLIRVRTSEGVLIFTCEPGKRQLTVEPGRFSVRVRVNLGPLIPGLFIGDVLLFSSVVQDRVDGAFEFEVLWDAERRTGDRARRYTEPVGPESAHAGLGLIHVPSEYESISSLEDATAL